MKPCPFCGESERLDIQEWVTCIACDAMGPSHGDDDPIEQWNRRTPDLAAIRAALDAERAASDATLWLWSGQPDAYHGRPIDDANKAARAALDALLGGTP